MDNLDRAYLGFNSAGEAGLPMTGGWLSKSIDCFGY